MSYVELVIKIPKEYYELLIQICEDPVLLNVFMSGTVLPKGHGRLIDADDIDNYIIGHVDIRNCPTIVEADRSESEDNK